MLHRSTLYREGLATWDWRGFNQIVLITKLSATEDFANKCPNNTRDTLFTHIWEWLFCFCEYNIFIILSMSKLKNPGMGWHNQHTPFILFIRPFTGPVMVLMQCSQHIKIIKYKSIFWSLARSGLSRDGNNKEHWSGSRISIFQLLGQQVSVISTQLSFEKYKVLRVYFIFKVFSSLFVQRNAAIPFRTKD